VSWNSSSFLPNGSAGNCPLSQVLEAQQHRQHPFELAVEVDLVAAEPLKPVGVERLSKRLLPDQRAGGQFVVPVILPPLHLTFEEASQALNVGGSGLLTLLQFVRTAGQFIGPLSPHVLA
jgi:hypothetical protein